MPRAHFLMGLGQCLAPRSTIPVNGNSGHIPRDTGPQRNNTRDIRGIDRLTDATKDHFVDQYGVQIRSGQQSAYGHPPQLVGAESG